MVQVIPARWDRCNWPHTICIIEYVYALRFFSGVGQKQNSQNSEHFIIFSYYSLALAVLTY